MDLVQLRYFLGVARNGGFGKAALALNVTQPALTRQVQLLEQELGTALLVRHPRGVEPTAAGKGLARRAEEILLLAQTAREEVLAHRGVVGGALRVGFSPSLGQLLLADTVSRFQQSFPDVALQFTEGFSQSLREKLLDDQLDLALVTNAEPHPHMAITHLFRESLWLLSPPCSNRKARTHYAFEDIVGVPLMRICPYDSVCAYLDREAHRRGFVLSYSMEAASDFLLKDFVKRGVGYRISPFSAVRSEVEAGQLCGGRIENLFVSRMIIQQKDREVTRSMTEFTNVLLSEAQRVWRQFKADFRPT